MQPTTNAQNPSWKEAAIKKAEGITDAWEVAKAYAGRAAEWVLFLCMIINIIGMLPGVSLAGWMMNLVLSVQVVMLDIGGMSLSSMAAYAKEHGDKKAAKQAEITSSFLIGLMIVTLLLVSVGVLFPAVKQYTDMAEKGLILVRVIMTVIYGHVLHALRGTNHVAIPVPASPASQPSVPSGTELETLIKDILIPVLEQYRTDMKADLEEQVKQMLSAMNARKTEDAFTPPTEVSKQPIPTLHVQRDAPLPARSILTQTSREARISSAYRELLQESIRPTGDTLSRRARCNRAAALKWLKTKELAR